MSYLRKLRPVSFALLLNFFWLSLSSRLSTKKRDSSVVPSCLGDNVAGKGLITISCLFFQTIKGAVCASNENTRDNNDGPAYRLHS